MASGQGKRALQPSRGYLEPLIEQAQLLLAANTGSRCRTMAILKCSCWQKSRAQLSLGLSLAALAAVCMVGVLTISGSNDVVNKPSELEMIVARLTTLDGEEAAEEGKEEAEGEEAAAAKTPEELRVHLKASADSIAYSCGGREVAETCLLGTETCVHSMQKKNKYTVGQTIARDMATCSCFQSNGCSAGCNAAMMSMFGGYISVADCPLDSAPFTYSSVNPFDIYGGGSAGFYDPSFMYSTAGAVYKAMPSQQMLSRVEYNEPVFLVSRQMKMMRDRKM